MKDVQFIVAGKDPSSKIKKLASRHIVITGFVDSIVDFLSISRVSVAPMVSGSGMQFKVLEAMSCGLPVVATPYGIGDIKANHLQEILIAENPIKFSEFVTDVLLFPEKYKSLSLNASKYVKNFHSWESHCNNVNKIYNSII